MLIEKKEEDETILKYSMCFQYFSKKFFKKYLITNIVSGNIDRNNNYSPMKILFTDKSDSDSEGQ